MGIDKSFELGSYIATIFSAATAFFAIRQSIMQRKLSIKPQLLIKRIELFAGNIDKNKFSISPFKGSDLKIFEPSIINTGSGSALNINIKWDYPYELKMRQLNECYKSINKEAKLEHEINDKLGVRCLEINTGEIVLYPLTNTDLIDFMAPINVEKKEYKTRAPFSIFNIMINDAMTLLHIENKLTKAVEGPSLNISYTDVEGKKYSLQYKSYFIVKEITALLYTNSISGILFFEGTKMPLANRVNHLYKKQKGIFINFVRNKLQNIKLRS
ncbi:hypothetical protein [Enterobacter hormaechei]|uniref:hypothetical protein n=1 Tax=Enterobacter hormaechei TaxID=158836 RepID=UPI00073512D5|nr:hypothetical protein [Enterobacter hormaechei]